MFRHTWDCTHQPLYQYDLIMSQTVHPLVIGGSSPNSCLTSSTVWHPVSSHSFLLNCCWLKFVLKPAVFLRDVGLIYSLLLWRLCHRWQMERGEIEIHGLTWNRMRRAEMCWTKLAGLPSLLVSLLCGWQGSQKESLDGVRPAVWFLLWWPATGMWGGEPKRQTDLPGTKVSNAMDIE